MTELKKLTIGCRRPVGAALDAAAGPLKPPSRAPAGTCGSAWLRAAAERERRRQMAGERRRRRATGGGGGAQAEAEKASVKAAAEGGEWTADDVNGR